MDKWVEQVSLMVIGGVLTELGRLGIRRIESYLAKRSESSPTLSPEEAEVLLALGIRGDGCAIYSHPTLDRHYGVLLHRVSRRPLVDVESTERGQQLDQAFYRLQDKGLIVWERRALYRLTDAGLREVEKLQKSRRWRQLVNRMREQQS